MRHPLHRPHGRGRRRLRRDRHLPGPPERHARGTGLADIGNLHVEPAHQGQGWERRLLGHAADWLRLCGTDRVLAYERAEDTAAIERLLDAGFHELTRTDRGWEHHPR
ncbi:GNAT family N-acetyltransferase [Streptomyces sp. NPDC052727]|uniref:GNAT family N-acetyltransferase n=1 Tax=Streptomyces sp. NPDC052727 TaxID=3154854 RepID=UPI00344AF5FC